MVKDPPMAAVMVVAAAKRLLIVRYTRFDLFVSCSMSFYFFLLHTVSTAVVACNSSALRPYPPKGYTLQEDRQGAV